jgi:excisionase family DNA binding protein
MQDKKCWKAPELAARYDVTPWRIYELVRDGKIPAIRLGRSVRFDPATIAAWEAQGGTAGSNGADEA